VGLLTPPPLPEEEVLAPGADPLPFADAIGARLGAPGAPTGRVLHAECGDGALLVSLTAAGIDAYGVDPGTTASDRATQAALDVRRDDVLGHLGSVGDEALAGLVLSACVDRLSLAERRRLLRLAEQKLAPNATVVVIGTTPEAWARTVGPVAADLSPGRPLHAATWAHLISQVGFSGVEVTSAGDGFAVTATKREVDLPVAAPGGVTKTPDSAAR
jgi:hypothetical protein